MHIKTLFLLFALLLTGNVCAVSSYSLEENIHLLNDTVPDLKMGTDSVLAEKATADCVPPAVDPGSGGETCGLTFGFSARLSTGMGFWSKESGPGSALFSDPTDPNSTVTVNTHGFYKFNWIEIDDICSADSTITVIFSQMPNANAGDDGTSCGLLYNLNATQSVFGSSGMWTQVSGPGEVQFSPSLEEADAMAVVDLPGDYRFMWTEINGTCMDDDVVDVQFLENPHAQVTDIGEVCDLSVQLDATPSVGTGKWEMVLGVGNPEFLPGNNVEDPQVNVDVSGDYIFKWTETHGVCSDDTSIRVTFKLQPTANPGRGGDVCGLGYQLGAKLSYGSGLWSLKSGPGIVVFFKPPTDPEAFISVTKAGTYEFTWTETNGQCSDDSTIAIHFFEPPDAKAGDGGIVCGSSFKLDATLSTGTGKWEMISGPGFASFEPGFRDPKAKLTIQEYGTYQLKWTETNGPCEDSDTIEITFNEQPIADAGGNGQSCSLSYQFNGKANVGAGLWTKIAGPGDVTFTPDNASGDASVSVTEYGAYDFQWRVGNGDCTDDSVITVQFYEQPVADAGDGGESCGLEYPLSAKLSSGLGTWQKISGPGTVAFMPDHTAPNALAAASEEGDYKLKWIEVNGDCSDEREIDITFYEKPEPDPGVGRDVCGPFFDLKATKSIGIGKWSQTSGDGTAFFAPSNDRPEVKVSVSEFGSYTFIWTETNGSCVQDSSIVVNFFEVPLADAGPALDVCGLTAQMAAVLSSGTGTWSKVSGPDVIDFAGQEKKPDALISVGTFGDYVLKWTETNGICSDDSTVVVRFMESIVADPGVIGKPCGLSYNFQAPLNGGTGKWTSISGPGSVRFVPDDNSAKAQMIVDTEGSYEVKWEVSNGSCSDDSTFSIQFYRQPVANVQLMDKVCGDEVIADLTLPFGTGTWEKVSGSGEISTLQEGNAVRLTSSNFGNFVLKLEVNHGHCADDTVLNIAFIEPPLGDPGKGGDACGNAFKLEASDGPGTGDWEKLSGPGDVVFTPDNLQENPLMTVSEYGQYVVKWTESNDVCQADSSITIIFYEQFEAGVLGDDSVCGTKTVLLGNDAGTTGEWIAVDGPSEASFKSPNQLATDVQVGQPGRYRFAWTVGQSICKDSAVQTLIFKPTANLRISDDVLYICEGSTAVLNASSGAPVKWESDYYISDPAALQQNVTPLENTNFVVSSKAANGCVDSATVTVFVDEQPEADAGPDQDLNYKFFTSLEALEPSVGYGTWQSVMGAGNLVDSTYAETQVTDLSIGENRFRWTVINGVCPAVSDEVMVLVNDLFIPNVMTPNGDGKNDYFVISGLENMGDNTLLIFNRWGNEVYKTDNYNNGWYGVDQDGNPLPVDTYFYIIEIKEESTLKGYISIKR